MDEATEVPTAAGADSPGSADDDDATEGRIGWTAQRVLGLLVALAIVGFWIWAFSPWAPRDKADGVRDAAFLARAKSACQTMQDGIAALPAAQDTKTAAARADVIASTGPLIATMVQDLRTAAGTLPARDAELVLQWLADWDAYNADRLDYASRLRTDERAEFFVTARGTGQITVTMDNFARVNDLAPCLTPQDV